MSKVQTVEAIPVSYPEPNDFNALRHLCLVKITTDDGVVGWGESITQFPEANFAAKAIIEGMAERVVGKDPLDNIAIWYSLRDQMWWYGYSGGIASYAVAAIDIALWDIKGKLLGRQRAPPAGRRRPREAAGRRVEPRPLRGHRPDGGGGPGVGRARDARASRSASASAATRGSAMSTIATWNTCAGCARGCRASGSCSTAAGT